ncbi:MAG: ShlB/FhaC/HecB family hemolysin secretion/activation protein [Pseudanabaenaceae cyanobacterium bins.68]|nr:ShlB/FhaC/HecB family hemolysin secretion/activation protein [Pseudanabaenaceae cyanobacterium bins.68]
MIAVVLLVVGYQMKHLRDRLNFKPRWKLLVGLVVIFGNLGFSPGTLAQAPPSASEQAEPTIAIKQIKVQGSTVFKDADFLPIIQPLLNQAVTLQRLRETADKISELYLENSYITSRAILPTDQPQLSQGIVILQVLEGELERIEIKRSGDVQGRLADQYLRDRIALGVTKPLNFAKIEEELQLLRLNPLIAEIRATLTAGTGAGQSVLQVTVTEANSFRVGGSVDNYGNSSTGIYRAGVNLQELNLFGIGDRVALGYTRASNSDSVSGGYQLPLNPTGGTLDFNFSLGQNTISEAPFDSLNIRTDAQTYELGYRQPVIRNPNQEIAFSLATALEQSNSTLDGRSFNFQSGEFDDGRSQATVLKLGQEYLSRDQMGAWSLRSSFNLGLNILGSTIRNNGSPDGRFFYWTGQVLRVHRFSEDPDTLMLFRLSAQLTGDSLLPLNRFSVGGPFSVRGYRQNQSTGDSGIQAALEFQLPIGWDQNGTSVLKLLPFVDAGTVWNSRGENVNQTLFGLGLGMLWQPVRQLNLRLDYGIPLNRVSNTTNNLQDAGFYFSLGGNF